MNRRKWLAAALVAVTGTVGGSLAYASTATATAKGYTCPVTGEELPCEKCCPLTAEAGQAAVQPGAPQATGEGDYTCPLTGETLGCPNCCPLNKAKR